jgi:hypothetical protein
MPMSSAFFRGSLGIGCVAAIDESPKRVQSRRLQETHPTGTGITRSWFAIDGAFPTTHKMFAYDQVQPSTSVTLQV